jgi:hypothetical protein
VEGKQKQKFLCPLPKKIIQCGLTPGVLNLQSRLDFETSGLNDMLPLWGQGNFTIKLGIDTVDARLPDRSFGEVLFYRQ